ncbi:MAG: HPr(Ser) kinase/phosphatase [Peptoniphilaceae bacterium]|nr:HPr(Ser) kinase/phosphatase [Peptoniphilaceae bacterium]MCI6660164.1 HPr(Ser) kinase/phosphatase [Peptoniphilaceae bacterium]MDD7433481.1 HPr(Ser) kinase/phosphatase [Peptoniphilaceae bacterium]MDY3076247.1 HPr(Ser) kinase/phosphatase [Peptoniphilaceae bacterium]MDY3987399.1 HPr(Ser) kinase/phosphatase [Peptoniphilaceae bacterium]
MTQLHNQVRLSELVKRMKLETVFQSTDYDGITISEMDLNRPGLQLSGYMGNFPYKRLQIIGRVEYNYYMEMPPNKRYERFRGIFSYPIPALIYSYNQEITRDILDLADYYNKTVLRSPLPTTKLIADMNGVLEDIMAPETTIHAGLMEVFGAGVLIRGKSAVGKSETGLDLVIRGHRLVADDVVNIRRIDNRLIGSAPENIRHYMEIRGLGILDIRRLYGVGSVKEDADIELVIDLEDWDENKEYDRLGLTEDHTDILGVSVPQIIVPVKPGRNISMIIEVATRNNRQKQLGYNAAVDLNQRLIEEANRMNGVTD